MRLPHHLHKNSCGVWCFRLIVPEALREALGVKVYRRSLGTKDDKTARLRAYEISLRYAQFLAERGGERVANNANDLLKKIGAGNFSEYKITETPYGTSVETDGTPQDNAAAQKMLAFLAKLAKRGGEGVAAPSSPQLAYAPQIDRITINEAVTRFLLGIKNDTDAATHKTKEAALREFENYTEKKIISEVTRTDCDMFRAFLVGNKNALPTLKNKFTYLHQLFEYCMTAGFYPDTKNPASNHIKYTKKQKTQRTKQHGWRAFTDAELKRIFDPEIYLDQTRPNYYWVPLLQLYTGSRVSEMCQIACEDIVKVAGLHCIKITDESDDAQSTKTENSIRTIPIHEDLIKLGFIKYIELQRKAGHKMIFPTVKAGANGYGGSTQKAFTYYLTTKVKISTEDKIGTHSLRKNIVQMLTAANVRIDIASNYVGHDISLLVGHQQPVLSSVHVLNYNNYRPTLFSEIVLPAINYSSVIDIERLKVDQAKWTEVNEMPPE